MRIRKADMYMNDRANTSKIVCDIHMLHMGYVSEIHWHDFFELEVVLEGRGYNILNGKRYEVVPGSAFLLSYNDFHTVNAQTDLKIYNIAFTQDSISTEIMNVLTHDGNMTCTFDINDLEEFENQMNFAERQKENPDFYRILKKNCLETLLIKMITDSSGSKPSFSSVVQNAVLIINNEFRSDISLEYVASKLFLTPNYLGTVFKESVGCSFRNYLKALRMRYARDLLVTTNLTVKEIAEECGFSSTEYFTNVFKQAVNISPTAYRNKNGHA